MSTMKQKIILTVSAGSDMSHLHFGIPQYGKSHCGEESLGFVHDLLSSQTDLRWNDEWLDNCLLKFALSCSKGLMMMPRKSDGLQVNATPNICNI